MNQSTKPRILVLNGPNLNMLGTREPEVYGPATLHQLLEGLRLAVPNAQFEHLQSNHEGELVEAIQQAASQGFSGIIINPGAYAHTSVAMLDAMRASPVRKVEVHLTNVHAREAFRHTLLTAGACDGTICGLGPDGYRLAAEWLLTTHKL